MIAFVEEEAMLPRVGSNVGTADIFLSLSFSPDPDDLVEEEFQLLLQRHQLHLGLFFPSLEFLSPHFLPSEWISIDLVC